MNIKTGHTTQLLLASLLIVVAPLAVANTLERVQASNSLTLGYRPDFAPFSSQTGDKVNGYAIDLCLKIAEKLKTQLRLPELNVRYLPVKTNEEIEAVSSGKVDMLCTPTPPTLVRRKSVSYSIPIYTAGLSSVVRQDAPEGLLNVLNGKVAHTGPIWRATINGGLANATFATTAGGVTESWIRQQMQSLGIMSRLVTVENTEAGLKLVADGKADVFFAERMLLSNVLSSRSAVENLMLLDRIFEYAPTAMALDRDDENFRLLVDTALSEMYRSGEIEQAYEKYLGGISDISRSLFKVYAIP
ncbi:amino acid ABC transporter substrate-binding protein [Pseudomonas sp. SK3(2021)]|uniref:amino acid ABC transporter substrate-binding protein n=1 Tax=Pseudomonas sp. SK3(2021) TaxID=2841064 RepID=UPI00192B2F9C|nr:amino acid ABC transporter substrate-binding protein [Pseudomonas sp. SK3(2021)]QQZ40036.1 amino acid ABC transporter substrate-binding protein [Pseudomonas sp. SK3(2021)]